MQDIKIPVPATQADSNGGDAVDSRTTPEPPVAISQKKTSKKKGTKEEEKGDKMMFALGVAFMLATVAAVLN